MKRILSKKKNVTGIFSVIIIAALFCTTVKAEPLEIFSNPANGWTLFADDDGEIGPGGGGQDFDAEYFFYQLNGDILSIGLQTGFDLKDGNQKSGSHKFYAGDLALSFDGSVAGEDGSGYEYAVDFGFKTRDWDGDKVGLGNGQQDPEGLYSVSEWNNDVIDAYAEETIPFAMDEGSIIANALSENAWGNGEAGGENSYYRIVSFNTSVISEIVPGEAFTVHAHWTMSCGNDAIDSYFSGGSPVPEPSTIVLLGIGLAGLVGSGYFRTRRRGSAGNSLGSR